ncbi:Mast cell protease 8 [Nibea albiflora]|uniref:Mast cell protease 8 n=1 Tax=Nibea albiflora TaxID=240163 RepID=A0ACB7EMU9_NIBAL|nr:Mast cell protease 8 [Nibea albiflora]
MSDSEQFCEQSHKQKIIINDDNSLSNGTVIPFSTVHTGQIFGGKEAEPHSRPYMVILERHMHNGSRKYCDGFILTEDFVMTAAHCQAKSYKVYQGVHDYFKKNEKQSVVVEKAFPHKDYDSHNYTNDVMILKLSSKMNFSKTVKPIPLAGQSDGPPKACIVSGWGATSKENKPGQHMSHVLMEVNVTLIDNKFCKSNDMYCSEGVAGPRVGDSGGPLVCDGKAYGVVSNEFQDSGILLYSYSMIPDQRSWIGSTFKNA